MTSMGAVFRQGVLGIGVKVGSGRYKLARRFRNERGYGRYGTADSRLGYAERLADFRLRSVVPYVGQRGCQRFEKSEAWRPFRDDRWALYGIYPDAQINDFLAVEPGGMIHVMACS